MASAATLVRIQAVVNGVNEIEALKNSIKTLNNVISPAASDVNKLANAAKILGTASNASARDLQRSISVLRDLQSQVVLGSQKYRELGRAIDDAQRRLDRFSQTSRRGGGLQRFGQTAGAIAAASVFGGPEGGIGAAIGALGGPGGALAGGAIGAQLGGIRQQIGSFSTYAADIQKLEIALKGVTKTQSEYDAAVKASAAVTRDFNVPQLEATKGMTQLSAAVIGAGGKVADAEVVFRNVTAAIKATGGSSEDAQGAITALSQIFSKGKVSAEELQGQLGERLPGAVTMFAQATGRTLPQLQKDLQNGTVGLADLMKFVVGPEGLGKFEQGALRVSQSSADAGARLTTTWNDVKRAIGEALQPLGAQIQDSLGRFLKEFTPTFIETAKSLGSAIKFLIDNFGAILNIARFAAEMAILNIALKSFVAFRPAIAAVFAEFQAGGVKAAIAAAGASTQVAKLSLALGSLAKLGIITVGVDLIVKGLSNFINAQSEINRIRGELSKNPVNLVGGSSQTREEVKRQQEVAKQTLAAIEKERKKYGFFNTFLNTPVSGLFGGQSGADVADRVRELKAREDRAKAVLGLDLNKFKPGASAIDNKLSDFFNLTGNDAKDKAAKDANNAEQQANRQYQLDLQTAQSQKQFADAVFKYQTDLDRKRYELNQELLDLQRNNYVNSFTGVRRDIAQASVDLARNLDALERRSVEAALNVRQAQQEYTTASNVAAVANSTAGGSTAGVYMQGGYGPRGSRDYDPHFDIKRQDGKYFSRRALDQYVSVNGRPLSTGITVPGGEFGAMRDGGARVHNARDYAFPGNAALTLTGGAKWLSSKTGSYGDNAVFMTPDGQIYRIIHGKFNAAGSSTQASQQRKGVKTAGAAAVEQLGVESALANQQATDESLKAQRVEIIAGYYQRITGGIKERVSAMTEEAVVLKNVNRLQMEGVRPELIDMERQLTQEAINKGNALSQLKTDLDTGKISLDVYKEGVRQTNEGYTALSEGIRRATTDLIAFNDALRVRQDYDIGGGFKEAAVQYIESIGTLKDATTKLALDGFKGVEDAIFSLVTTGQASFKEFAASILKQTARMIIQQLVLRTIMQAIGAIGGGPTNALGSVESNLAKYAPLAKGGVFAANGIQPFAMGGIVDKPTLFKFANGGTGRLGLMGEAGPEAIVPLRRGRDGKLGIAGGGGSTTVNVSVDASGSPQVSGNGGQGEQLGRAIAGAVQQELIRQKRPGGILAQ